jgi:hypothetical protein
MLFAEMFDSARTWVAGNLPVAVGAAVAVLVLGFLCVNTALRRRKGLDPSKLATASSVLGEKALNWDPSEPSYADRRGSIRREGQPVRVVLAASTFRSGAADGYVVDRSTGGLKIAVQVAVAPGSLMQVRAADAPDTIGFVALIVRSCRKTEHHYELGCEFEKTPPWNVLLLFG